jgi:hypothetical protein
MALRKGNSALQWAVTRPEDSTRARAVAEGHFVQVGQHPGTVDRACPPDFSWGVTEEGAEKSFRAGGAARAAKDSA